MLDTDFTNGWFHFHRSWYLIFRQSIRSLQVERSTVGDSLYGRPWVYFSSLSTDRSLVFLECNPLGLFLNDDFLASGGINTLSGWYIWIFLRVFLTVCKLEWFCSRVLFPSLLFQWKWASQKSWPIHIPRLSWSTHMLAHFNQYDSMWTYIWA